MLNRTTCYLGRKQVERAIDARRDSRQYDAHVAFEPFGSAVDQRNHGGVVEHLVLVVRQQRNEHAVDPAPRHHGVQAADDEMELPIEVLVHVLYLAVVGRDAARGHPLVDELGRHLRLGAVHVPLAEQKLPVQVGQINGVHVDDVHVAEAHHGQVLEQLATEPAGADHQQLARVLQKVQYAGAGLEVRMTERAGTFEDLLQVAPSPVLGVRRHAAAEFSPQTTVNEHKKKRYGA